MTRNYNPTIWGSVPVVAGTGTIKYTFRCRAPEAELETLGITPLLASEITSVTGYAIGVNSPKPPRAKKAISGVNVSTFCDSSLISSIESEGWTVSRAKKARNIRNSASVQTYVVTINGISYAWNLPKLPAGATIPASLADMGAVPAEAGQAGLVWGASFPKPPRGTFQITIASTTHNFSTYVSPTATLATGWAVTGGNYSLDDFKAAISKTAFTGSGGGTGGGTGG
jgi:hypothetical protein